MVANRQVRATDDAVVAEGDCANWPGVLKGC
jgi:hypothetical protein